MTPRAQTFFDAASIAQAIYLEDIDRVLVVCAETRAMVLKIRRALAQAALLEIGVGP